MYTTIILGSVAIFLLRALAPASFEPERNSLWLMSPPASRVLNYAVGAAGIVLLITGGVCARRKRWVRTTLAINLAVLGIPATLFLLVFNILRTGRDFWTEGPPLTAADGQVYAYLQSSILECSTQAIGRLADHALLYERYELVGRTNAGDVQQWIWLVRPSGVGDNKRFQLLSSADGMLVALRFDSQCFMAYDVHTHKFFDFPQDRENSDQLSEISPFLLIGPDATLNPADVVQLSTAADYPNRDRPISPALIRAALDHPNPEVRRVAAELLQAIEMVEANRADQTTVSAPANAAE
ncbi:MAG TPA: hypothetical protein VHY91_27300 [Pirellulales bacterium]|nr:hypothetical protein [Pirellulales bacterium]